MLIEFPDSELRKRELSQLIGIEEKVWIQIGQSDRIFAIADEDLDRSNEEKTSAVHFLRFELSNLMIKEFKSGATLFTGIAHPNYNIRTKEIHRLTTDSLVRDIT